MKITIQAGENTYLIASKTTPVDGIGIYQGRLLNELKISRRFSKAGNAPLTLNISIRNNDGFIPRAINLWAAVVTVVTDAGYRWVGKITAYDRDNSDVLNIVATERSAPELRIQFPDEVAGVVTLDENAHQSTLTLTLPLVAGGNADQPILLKGILIRKDLGIYKLCVGEIHQIVKVYRGGKALTTGFSAFTGSAGQANYAGYAYVQITDEALRKNDDGTYSEITADVIGLKLGSHSIEECRNGARFLQYLLSTPKDGICGWGLGISSSEINSASFATAISRVDAAGLKMDGVFYFRQIAQSWIDQICQAIRGDYEIGENGQRRLFVNANTASVKTYTKKNIKLLRDGKGSYSGQVYNKGRLEFDYNPLTGIFMQSAQFQDPDCIDDIEEQLFLGQSYLIRDMATAQAILEYTCKKSIVGADKVYFETLELPDDVKKGDIITIDYPEKALTGTWQIFAFDIGDYKHSIEAEKITSDIFTVVSAGNKVNWPKDLPVISPVIPGSPSGLNLSSEVLRAQDGTNIVILKGQFTLPAGAYMAASIDYGLGIEPENWITHAMITGDNFEIKPVKAGQLYSVRIRMMTSTGHSDYVTGSITTQGDSEPPGVPTISASAKFMFAQIAITLENPADDLAGFKIYRSITPDSANAEYVTSVASKDGSAGLTNRVPSFTDTYYYFAKSFDTWKNDSDFSAASGPVKASKLLDADILRKLTPADALNTDPYFTDWSAWSGDLAGAESNPDNFTTIGDGVAGATAFKTAAGQKIIFGISMDALIPFDSTRRHILTAFIRATGGGTHGLGFAFYDIDRQLIGQSSSAEYAIAPVDTWEEYSKTFSSVPAGTVFIGPMIVCNNGTTAGVIVEIQKLRLREVLTADMLIANEAIITQAIQIATGIINDAHILSVDAGKIKSGFIDTERLAADVARIKHLSAMGKNMLQDPTFLSFPKGWNSSVVNDQYEFGPWTLGSDRPLASDYAYIFEHERYLDKILSGKGLFVRPCPTSSPDPYRIWLAQQIVVAPAERYCFSAYVNKLADTDGFGNPTSVCEHSFIIAWHNNDAFISQIAGENNREGRFYIEGISPANATHAIIYILIPPHVADGTLAYVLLSNLQFERCERQFEDTTEIPAGPTVWVPREQGTIRADNIFGGLLQSWNWGPYAGSSYDLLNGHFMLGGSAEPQLSWDGQKLDNRGQMNTRGEVFYPVGASVQLGVAGVSQEVGVLALKLGTHYSLSQGLDVFNRFVLRVDGPAGIRMELTYFKNLRDFDFTNVRNLIFYDSSGDSTKTDCAIYAYGSDYYLFLGSTSTAWGWGNFVIESAPPNWSLPAPITFLTDIGGYTLKGAATKKNVVTW